VGPTLLEYSVREKAAVASGSSLSPAEILEYEFLAETEKRPDVAAILRRLPETSPYVNPALMETFLELFEDDRDVKEHRDMLDSIGAGFCPKRD
jgi:hypothetical protein